MASSSLSLCSSLALQCTLSNNARIHHTNANLRFLSLPSSSSSASKLSLRAPSRRALPPPPKASDAPAIDAEVDAPVIEDAEPVEASPKELPAPMREEIFAVVMIGGRQYIVFPGRFIYTQRLKGANVDDKIVLKKVLLIGTKTTTYIGKPVVTNAAVHAVVEEQVLDKKVIVFKYKRKKNYRRNIGHRQPITRIRITGITGYEDYPAVTLESQEAQLKLKSQS